MTPRNIFVVAADSHNMRHIEPLEDLLNCRFRPLLSRSVRVGKSLAFDEPLKQAISELDAIDDPIDGIMGWWDFPVSSLVPVLNERYGAPGPSVDAVLRCEHKYRSRLLQREVAPEMVPRFAAVDPFDDDAIAALADEPGYPFWLKPIKAHSSQLGFRIDDDRELERALQRIRRGIDRFAPAFDEALAHSSVRQEAGGVGGRWCLAESLIGGHQVTLEGYVFEGEVVIPTIVDSIAVANSSSFARYQYPSKLPEEVRARMRESAAAVITRHGFDTGTFNIELYWDEDADRIWLLEINPRSSQSHTIITEQVDGLPHLEAAAALALGERPAPHLHSRGSYGIAAKHFVRAHDDALVTRVPRAEEIARVEDELDCHIEIEVEEGERLSDMVDQDSYSYAYATIHLGADDEEALKRKYQRCLDALRFDFQREAA